MATTSFLSEQTQQIEEHLAALIPLTTSNNASLYEAARYSLLSGGKRLRPLLTLTTATAMGATIQQALTPACAIEMIHTYSLIHDDLPCMDDDSFRRGKPTLHCVYPEGHAVLTGDFLLTYAFEVLAQAPALTPQQRINLVATLANNIGSEGLIGGQALDLQAVGHDIDKTILDEIHHKKTAKLLNTALVFGGIIAGANINEIESLRALGNDIGLAFQIIDDILDVTKSHDKHGTSTSSDTINNKTTYVTLLGKEQAQHYAQQLIDSASKKLQALPYDMAHVQDIVDMITQQTS